MTRPVFGGFSVSASWGEDDIWAVASRYAGEWHDFKVAAAAAYNEVTDRSRTLAFLSVSTIFSSTHSDYFQAGAYIEHIPTGLFVYGAYGHDLTLG